jgi:hypothetical protein
MDEKATSDEDEERHEDKERPGDSNDVAPPAQVCTPALLETTPNIRNQTENILGTHLKGSKRQEDGSQCRKIAAVQTTLNLSMNETVYTECKECDMLYNHLDKTDVKHHARHHAALVRAKARAGAKNNAAE